MIIVVKNAILETLLEVAWGPTRGRGVGRGGTVWSLAHIFETSSNQCYQKRIEQGGWTVNRDLSRPGSEIESLKQLNQSRTVKSASFWQKP